MTLGWVGCLALAVLIRKRKDFAVSTLSRFEKTLSWFALLLGFSAVIAWIFLQPPFGLTSTSRSIFQKLQPLLLWAIVFALQFILFHYWMIRPRINWQSNRIPLIWAGLFLVVFSGLILTALVSGAGLSTISGTFYRQGVPLLEGHLLYPLLAIFLLMLIKLWINQRVFWKRNAIQKMEPSLTLALAALVWIAASVIWIRTPFEGRSYFLPALRPPNMNFYPSSDAESYDLLAQNILIGSGFRNGMTVVRPLYAAFLALLHALAGNDYMQVTNLQIIFLALFPVAVFLLGTILHSRFSGILAALWIIFREMYSIRLTPLVQVSNSRLFMSDLPTACMVSWLLVALVLWIKSINPDAARKWALVTGGLTGLAFLIRTQTFVFILAILFLMIVYYARQKSLQRIGLRAINAYLSAVMIIVMPWLILNRALPNQSVDLTKSEGAYLSRLYERAAGLEDSENGKKSIFELIAAYPKQIGEEIGAHFINNELSSLLVLPARTEAAASSADWMNDESVFWYRESSEEVVRKNPLLLARYLVVISFGVGAAVKKHHWAGLVPLALHVVYSAGTALAMNSGFRFILPVDWILMFYFAIGCVSLLHFVTDVIELPQEEKISRDDLGFYLNNRQFLPMPLIIICLIISGLILPVCDQLIPARYDRDKSELELLSEWSRLSEINQKISTKNNLEEQIAAQTLTILEGRSVYPRFYAAEEGDSGGASSVKTGVPYNRLVWMQLNDNVQTVSLPVAGYTIESCSIPDPVDAIVIGREKADHFAAEWVSFSDSHRSITWTASSAANNCDWEVQ